MKANKEFEFPNNIEGLQIKSKLPSKGKMIINTNGEIAVSLSNGRYTVTKGFEDTDVTITEKKIMYYQVIYQKKHIMQVMQYIIIQKQEMYVLIIKLAIVMQMLKKDV